MIRLAPLIIILFFLLIAALLYSLFYSDSGINERNMIVESNKELLEENQRLMDLSLITHLTLPTKRIV